jgi:hypothetical protein
MPRLIPVLGLPLLGLRRLWLLLLLLPLMCGDRGCEHRSIFRCAWLPGGGEGSLPATTASPLLLHVWWWKPLMLLLLLLVMILLLLWRMTWRCGAMHR